ncbi:MAG: hypothetical protein Q4F71_05390 [Paracoccus sp. (in: a-proteobacteria)]|nr:hypothetical protein [Paracoccus sp. (in: a-proteobacteria)]
MILRHLIGGLLGGVLAVIAVHLLIGGGSVLRDLAVFIIAANIVAAGSAWLAARQPARQPRAVRPVMRGNPEQS